MAQARKQSPPRRAVRNNKVLLIRSLTNSKDNKVDRAPTHSHGSAKE